MIFEPVSLNISQVSCERDDRLLFQNLSFALSSGDILRVAGPNGAGKTTLLRMIAGLFEVQDPMLFKRMFTFKGFLKAFFREQI